MVRPPSPSTAAVSSTKGAARAATLNEEMRALVREQRLGFVATVCPDGTPNLSPKGTVSVWDDEHLVFLDLCSPGTIGNVAANPSVEINVVDPIRRKGFRFKGTARLVGAGELFDRICAFYTTPEEAKLRGAAEKRALRAVLVRVTRAEPLWSPTYDTGAHEADVASAWLAYVTALALTRTSAAPEQDALREGPSGCRSRALREDR